jgi:DNA-binding XRE family transcriptional regulator
MIPYEEIEALKRHAASCESAEEFIAEVGWADWMESYINYPEDLPEEDRAEWGMSDREEEAIDSDLRELYEEAHADDLHSLDDDSDFSYEGRAIRVSDGKRGIVLKGFYLYGDARTLFLPLTETQSEEQILRETSCRAILDNYIHELFWEDEHKLVDVKMLRSMAGLTQQKLSNLVGIPKRTIQNWETGDRQPPEYLINLIEYYLVHEGKIKG